MGKLQDYRNFSNRLNRWVKSSMVMLLCTFTSAWISAAETANTEVQSVLPPAGPPTSEEVTLKIFVSDWQNYSGIDGEGLYFDIIRALFTDEPIELQFVHQPIRRGMELLKRGQGDAVLGLWHHRYSAGGAQYLTGGLPLDVEVVSAVFPSSSDWDWQRLSTEKDARYAWVKGYEYGVDLNLPSQAQVPASINGLRMLKQGHIDGFIDDQFYVNKVLKASPNFEISDYRFEPIVTRNMYLAFQQNKKGERWLAIYRKNMEKLLRQGTLHTLFRKWDLDYEKVKYRDLDRY